MNLDEAAEAFRQFVDVVKALRTPGTGCPWDLEQTHATLRPYLLEEACEVIDAIDAGDDAALREELGDLLLQVVLHGQLADDRAAFSVTEVVRGITEKMVRRHPHVFGPARVRGSEEVLRNWERIKAEEKREAGRPPSPSAGLEGVPRSLPALLRAQRLLEKAAKAGFAGPSLEGVLGQVREKLAGLEDAIEGRERPDEPPSPPQQELGDLLFNLCQLARRLGLSAEDSLRATSGRFIEQFRQTEGQAPATE